MPRSPDRYDRDRRNRDRDRNRPQKDYSGEVSKMKEKMRNTLETARNSTETQKTIKKEEVLTAEEQLARTRAIEQIEESGFQPASFRSGGGGNGNKKTDQKSKKETSHEAAIFGPAWKSAEQRKAIEKKESDISTISLPTAPVPSMNAMAPMVPSDMMSSNSEKRNEEWRTWWSHQRQLLIAKNY